MGAEQERDELLTGKAEKQIQGMRVEAEEILEFYVSVIRSIFLCYYFPC